MIQIEVEQTDEGIFTVHEGERMPVVCHWFARCENQAMTTRSHPVMGDVPICTRCDERVGRMA